jgi:hypothetical protein
MGSIRGSERSRNFAAVSLRDDAAHTHPSTSPQKRERTAEHRALSSNRADRSTEKLSSSDKPAAQRATAAMLDMQRHDIAVFQRAFDGQ